VKIGEVLIRTFPIFHWAQAAPTKYRDRLSHCCTICLDDRTDAIARHMIFV